MVESSTYAERFLDALQSSGLTMRDVAKLVGVSYQALKKIDSGTSGMLAADNNARAAAAMNVSSDWLATGQGHRSRNAFGISDAALRVARIYDQVSAKDRRHIDAAADAAASPDSPAEPAPRMSEPPPLAPTRRPAQRR